MSSDALQGSHPFLRENLHKHVSENSIKIKRSASTRVAKAITRIIRDPKFFEHIDQFTHHTINHVFGNHDWDPITERQFTENARMIRIGLVAMGVFTFGMFSGLFAGIPAVAAFLFILGYGILTSDNSHAPEAVQVRRLVTLMDPLLVGLKEQSEISLKNPRKSNNEQKKLLKDHGQPFIDCVHEAITQIENDQSISPANQASRILSLLIAIDKILDQYAIRYLFIQTPDGTVLNIGEYLHKILENTLCRAEKLIEEGIEQQTRTLEQQYRKRTGDLLSGEIYDANAAEQTFYAVQAAESLLAEDGFFKVSDDTGTSPATEQLNPLLNVQEELRYLITFHSGKNPNMILITPRFLQTFVDARSRKEVCKVLQTFYQITIDPENDVLSRILSDPHLFFYRTIRDLREATQLLSEYKKVREVVAGPLDISFREISSLKSIHEKLDVKPTQAKRLATLMARDIAYNTTLDTEIIRQQAQEKAKSSVAKRAGFRECGITGEIIELFVYQILRNKYDRPIKEAEKALGIQTKRTTDLRQSYGINTTVDEEALEEARTAKRNAVLRQERFEDEFVYTNSEQDRIIESVEKKQREATARGNVYMLTKIEQREMAKKNHDRVIASVFRKHVEAEKQGELYQPSAIEQAEMDKTDKLQKLYNKRKHLERQLEAMEEIMATTQSQATLEAFLHKVEQLGTVDY